MKIILTTLSPSLDSEIDPRFGRGAYFLQVDSDTLEWEAFQNPAVNAHGGAGIQAAQFVSDRKVDAVISGDFGPNAYQALNAAGLLMYVCGSGGTAREIVERFKLNQLEQAGSPMWGQGRRRR